MVLLSPHSGFGSHPLRASASLCRNAWPETQRGDTGAAMQEFLGRHTRRAVLAATGLAPAAAALAAGPSATPPAQYGFAPGLISQTPPPRGRPPGGFRNERDAPWPALKTTP